MTRVAPTRWGTSDNFLISPVHAVAFSDPSESHYATFGGPAVLARSTWQRHGLDGGSPGRRLLVIGLGFCLIYSIIALTVVGPTVGDNPGMMDGDIYSDAECERAYEDDYPSRQCWCAAIRGRGLCLTRALGGGWRTRRPA